MTRHDEDVVDHRTLNARCGQFCLVSHLRLVFVKVLGQINLRLFDEFQITRTTDGDTYRDRIVGLRLRLAQRGRDCEMAYAAREASRPLWQGIHLNINAWGDDLLLYLDITRATVEECLEGIDVTILLYDDALEGDAGNLKLACHLWEHHILTPRGGPIRTSVEGLNRETLLCRQTYLLGVEALQVGHITTQTGQPHKGIDLIGKEDRLLFIDTLLVGTDLDEKVGTGYLTARISDFPLLVLTMLTRGPS